MFLNLLIYQYRSYFNQWSQTLGCAGPCSCLTSNNISSLVWSGADLLPSHHNICCSSSQVWQETFSEPDWTSSPPHFFRPANSNLSLPPDRYSLPPLSSINLLWMKTQHLNLWQRTAVCLSKEFPMEVHFVPNAVISDLKPMQLSDKFSAYMPNPLTPH